MALQPLWTLAAVFQFLNIYTVGRTPWTEDQPVARPLLAQQHNTTEQHKQSKRTHTSIPLVGFEPTSSVFEREKTIHDLDRAATSIGPCKIRLIKLSSRDRTLKWETTASSVIVLSSAIGNILPYLSTQNSQNSLLQGR
jgi:hypothetical protein